MDAHVCDLPSHSRCVHVMVHLDIVPLGESDNPIRLPGRDAKAEERCEIMEVAANPGEGEWWGGYCTCKVSGSAARLTFPRDVRKNFTPSSTAMSIHSSICFAYFLLSIMVRLP